MDATKPLTTLPPVTAGFCSDHDHLVITIGDLKSSRVVGKLQLWATDHLVENLVDDALDGISMTHHYSISYFRAEDVLSPIRHSPDLVARLKEAIIAAVATFRASSPMVAERTQYWRQRRSPSRVIRPNANDVEQYGTPERRNTSSVEDLAALLVHTLTGR